jgi:glycosyltransferase involved in cell wall biosynthesis
MKPSLSVIICIYNGDKTLEASVTSLLNQAYPKNEYEIILLDDGSRDNSSKICENLIENSKGQLPIIKYQFQNNKGLAIARNAGISLSSGKIVAFIDQDAVAKSDWLTELMKPFIHYDADFVGGRVELLNTKSKIAFFSQIARHIQIFGQENDYNTFVGCNMAFKKTIFYESGGFYENFASLGDETSLFERIKDCYQYRSNSDAVVYHERTEKLSDFVLNEWRTAVLNGLCRKSIKRKLVFKEIYIIIEHLLIILFPFMLVVLNEKSALIILLLSSTAFMRRMFFSTRNSIMFVNLKLYYGIINGLCLHILYWYCSTIIIALGQFIGFIKFYNIDLIPGIINKNKTLNKYLSNE